MEICFSKLWQNAEPYCGMRSILPIVMVRGDLSVVLHKPQKLRFYEKANLSFDGFLKLKKMNFQHLLILKEEE